MNRQDLLLIRRTAEQLGRNGVIITNADSRGRECGEC